jgi:hypothetical protein
MKPRSYSIKEVYDAAMVAFTFEFYCSKEQSFIIEDFKSIVKKNVVLTDQPNVKPTYSSFVLLKEYDGKRPRYQFKVGYQNYSEVSTFLNTMLFWINENASLNESTLLKTSLTYNFNELKTISSISNMDVTKLILKLDENYIYERFNEMKGNPFVMSAKKLVPYNMSVNVSNVVNVRNQFNFGVGKYYGIDLSDQVFGELSFNYIGGPKYSEKVKEIYEILEYYVITTYQVLNEPNYSTSEIEELNRLTEEFRTFKKCYYNARKFLDNYKDIKIFIDLNNNPNLIETQWFQIRDKMTRLVLENNIKKCKFNYDTETGMFEVKDAEISSCFLKNLNIIDSKISGVIEHCKIWQCEISNSRVNDSIFVNKNTVSNSFMERIRADKDNKINDSFITNTGEIINCKVTNSIIKNAGIGNFAKLDENCLIIHPIEKNINPEKIGINVTEPRDYQWIKSLRDVNYKDKGFVNLLKDE